MRKVKNLGISLLELLLSLTIIAILLVMATRYYALTRSEQQVNEAITMINQAIGATDNWYWTFGTYTPTWGDIKVKELIDMGLLPKDFANSPWGTPLSIEKVDGNTAKITIENILNADCLNLQAILCDKENIQATCVTDQGATNFVLPRPSPACTPTPP